jgi:hypothetical protein
MEYMFAISVLLGGDSEVEIASIREFKLRPIEIRKFSFGTPRIFENTLCAADSNAMQTRSKTCEILQRFIPSSLLLHPCLTIAHHSRSHLEDFRIPQLGPDGTKKSSREPGHNIVGLRPDPRSKGEAHRMRIKPNHVHRTVM